MAGNRATVYYFVMAIFLLLDVIFAQDQIEMKCNPSIRHRFDVCPEGYCCVRDEFLPTYVYCRKIGLEDDNCTTKDNESECPCAAGLYCKANIASQFLSLYGRCYNTSKDATTTTSTTINTDAATTTITNATTNAATNITNNTTTMESSPTATPTIVTSDNTPTTPVSADTTKGNEMPFFQAPIIG